MIELKRIIKENIWIVKKVVVYLKKITDIIIMKKIKMKTKKVKLLHHNKRYNLLILEI